MQHRNIFLHSSSRGELLLTVALWRFEFLKEHLLQREAWLRPDERGEAIVSSEKLKRAVDVLVQATEHTLCGIDFIVEQDTEKLYVLDFNNFPGFTGVDNFMGELTDLIVRESGVELPNGVQPS